MLRLALALISLCASLVLATSSTGSRVLVVLEPKLNRADFTDFFGRLEERGYELSFRAPKDPEPALLRDDVPQFDHIVLFAPTSKNFADDLLPQSLVKLLERKINLFIALGPSQTPFHSFAGEFGLILPPPHTPLISHFGPGGTKSAKPDLITVELNGKNPTGIMRRSFKRRFWMFKGIPMALGNNPALFPILKAPAESYASDSDFSTDKGADAIAESAEKGGEGLWAGTSMALVAGFVASNGGRVLFSGSIDMFSNTLHDYTNADRIKSANTLITDDLTSWTFQESLVIKVVEAWHHHDVSIIKNKSASFVRPAQPEFYTINDVVNYTIHIKQFQAGDNKWVPFNVSYPDMLQVSYTMLDPHIRVALEPIKNMPGYYSTIFRVPDRHGVFRFAFEYKRKAWTPLSHMITAPLVPPRHDGYPRFLSSAWPYYAGAISTSVAFVLFCAVWLGGAADIDKKKKKE